MALQQPLQFSGAGERLASQPLQPGHRHLQRTMEQGHLRSPQPRRLGQQHPHRPGGGIGEMTGWIQCLAAWARAHEQATSREVPQWALQRQGLRSELNQLRLHHAAAAAAIAGQQPLAGRWQRQDMLIKQQPLPIALHRWGFPHVGVHCCCHQHRRPAGHHRGGKQGVGQSMHQPSEGGGTQWGQQQQVRPFRQLDVQRARGSVVPLVLLEHTRLSREAGEGDWADQLRGAGGEQTAHLGSTLDQGADQRRHLHGGDAAADPHQNPPSAQGVSRGHGSVLVEGFLIHQMHIRTHQLRPVDGQSPQQVPIVETIKGTRVVIQLKAFSQSRHGGLGVGSQKLLGDQARSAHEV